QSILLRNDAWLLVALGLFATALALFSLLLEFKLASPAPFIGWVLYFPVIFNTLIPMFIAFFSVIGIFYTPWLLFTEIPSVNKIMSGIIRLQDTNITTIIDYSGYALIGIGLTIYIDGLHQILSHTAKRQTLITRGLYGTVRHPQYLGIFMWTLGFAMTGWRLINYLMWITLCFSYLLLAEYEEQQLAKRFGQEYVMYKKKVPFMFPLASAKLDVLNLSSKPKTRLLIYTAIYLILMLTFYYTIEPYTVVLR
ncbi:MAG: methyltransferase, partial [Candidatus Bathyarchaeia archaeon]